MVSKEVDDLCVVLNRVVMVRQTRSGFETICTLPFGTDENVRL